MKPSQVFATLAVVNAVLYADNHSRFQGLALVIVCVAMCLSAFNERLEAGK